MKKIFVCAAKQKLGGSKGYFVRVLSMLLAVLLITGQVAYAVENTVSEEGMALGLSIDDEPSLGESDDDIPLGLSDNDALAELKSKITEFVLGLNCEASKDYLAERSTDDQLYVYSGSQVTAKASFSFADANGAVVIEGGDLAVRFTLHKINASDLSWGQNEGLAYQIGGADAADGDPDVDAEHTYVWVTWTKDFNPGSGQTVSLKMCPSANGVTPSGTSYPVEAQLFFQGKVVGGLVSDSEIVAVAPYFDWNAVSTNPQYLKNNVAADIPKTAGIPTLTLGRETDIPTFSFVYEAGSQHAGKTTGLVYGEKIVYEDTFAVPVDENGMPQILFTKEMIQAPNSDTELIASVLEAKTVEGVDYVTKFSVSLKSTDAESANKLAFQIAGAKVGGEIEYVGGTATLSLKSTVAASTGSMGSVTPLVAYETDEDGTTSKEKKTLYNDASVTQVDFVVTTSIETGSETENNGFKKSITNIGSTNTNGTTGELSGFATNEVVYKLDSFKNMQEGPLDSLTITDAVYDAVSNPGGYKLEEIVPIRLTTGQYIWDGATPAEQSKRYKITIGYSGGLSDTVIYRKFNEANATNVLSNSNKIVSIVYDFAIGSGNDGLDKVPMGFRPTGNAPTITYRVLDQDGEMDEQANPIYMKNTAKLDYQYTLKDVLQNHSLPSEAVFRYREIPTVDVSNNKKVENLTTKNATKFKPGDILRFTITINNSDVNNKTWGKILVEDTYSDNLKPYHGILPDGTAADANQTSHMKLTVIGTSWNQKETPYPALLPQPNGVKFDAGKHLITVETSGGLGKSGTITLTYVMQVQTVDGEGQQYIHNSYKASAYIWQPGETGTGGPGGPEGPGGPGGPGDQRVEIPGGNFGHTVDKGSLKPMVSIVKTVNTVGGTDPQALRDGDQVGFKVTVRREVGMGTGTITLKNLVDDLSSYLNYVPFDAEKDSLTFNHNPITDFTFAQASSGSKRLYLKLNTPTVMEEGDILEFSYRAQVVATGLTGSGTANQTNTAYALIKETYDSYGVVQGTGPENDSGSGIDQDNDTKSRVKSTAAVKILYGSEHVGDIAKKVNSASILVSSGGTLQRTYTVEIQNTGRKDFTVNHLVDLLPKFETLDGGVSVAYQTQDGRPATLSASADQGGSRLTITPGTEGLVIHSGETVKLSYKVKIDHNGALAAIHQSKYGNSNVIDDVNKVAMYVREETFILKNGAVGQVHSDNGSDDWDDNLSTAARYQAQVNVKLTANLPGPMVDIKAQTITSNAGTGSETFHDYSTADTVTPGDTVGWKITVGNSYETRAADLQPGAKLVVVLPAGMTFKGYEGGQRPSYLDAEAITSHNGTQVITWNVNKLLKGGVDNDTFRIKVGTSVNDYTSYTAHAYLIPADGDVFLDSMVKGTGDYKGTTYDYEPERLDMAGISGEAGTKHLVHSYDSLNAYGEIAVSSKITVSNSNATPPSANSTDSTRVIQLADKTDTFTYTLEVKNERAGSSFRNLVLINRLPSVGDGGSVVSTSPRGSKADVRLTDGTIAVKIDGMPLQPNQYTVEYYIGTDGATKAFTASDWAGDSAGYWKANPTQQEYGQATAFRIKLADGVVLSGNQTLTAEYEANFPDYEQNLAVAYNSFGFSFLSKIDRRDIRLTPEPIKVGVCAEVPEFMLGLKKIVNLKSTLQPKDYTFTFRVVGARPGASEKLFNETFEMNVSLQNGVWESNRILSSYEYPGLRPDLEYIITEINVESLTGKYTVADTYPAQVGGMMVYTITNTPEPDNNGGGEESSSSSSGSSSSSSSSSNSSSSSSSTPTYSSRDRDTEYESKGRWETPDDTELVTITDGLVPLAPGLVTIIDEGVPLGNLPRTGGQSATRNTSCFNAGMMLMGAAAIGEKKEDEEA
ncbi:hypothetical protein U6B65_12265 [Oscillospiraceae bacterium MB08-C2-2]|nr:hypothetical protein U6B65_12265 [Oscillospiraceae bacterium MB08-C2-2]